MQSDQAMFDHATEDVLDVHNDAAILPPPEVDKDVLLETIWGWSSQPNGHDVICQWLNDTFWAIGGAWGFLTSVCVGVQQLEEFNSAFDLKLRSLSVEQVWRMLIYYVRATPLKGARYICAFCNEEFTCSGLHTHGFKHHRVSWEPCRFAGCDRLFPRFKERDLHEADHNFHKAHEPRIIRPRRNRDQMIRLLVSLLLPNIPIASFSQIETPQVVVADNTADTLFDYETFTAQYGLPGQEQAPPAYEEYEEDPAPSPEQMNNESSGEADEEDDYSDHYDPMLVDPQPNQEFPYGVSALIMMAEPFDVLPDRPLDEHYTMEY